MKRICIIIFNLTKQNIKLQPWRYLFELLNTINNEFEIHIITNKKYENELHLYKIHDNIEISPYRNSELLKKINSINPEIVFWWASKKTFLYIKLFKKLNKKIILYYTGPIYYFKSEILPIIKYIPLKDIQQYVIDSLIPVKLSRYMINSNIIQNTIVMTERNFERLVRAGINPKKIIIIPQGYSAESKFSAPFSKKAITNTNITILYMGRATPLRGVEFLIQSFDRLIKKTPNAQKISLFILSRDSDDGYIEKLKFLIDSLSLGSYVHIINGWLKKETLERYMHSSKFLVMPFLLVPSEIPMSILEYLSLGKPVIGPDLDGIPELLRPAQGIIYKHWDQDDLTDAMFRLIMDNELYSRICKSSYFFMKNYYTWENLKLKLKKILL